MLGRAGVLEFATKAHEGQVRKYSGQPYIVHPIEVATIVKDFGGSQDQIDAALLHDVVEDTDVTIDQIKELFGNNVAELVFFLTDISKKSDGNRATRKAIDRAHILSGPADSQFIKCADFISNSADILVNDPHFAVVYTKEIKDTLDAMTKLKGSAIHSKALSQVS